MAQQVVRAKTTIPSTISLLDAVSIDFYFEATGSNPNLDFTAADNPLVRVTNFFNVLATGQTATMAHYMSSSLSHAANAVVTTWTDITAHLDGSPAGPAFRTDTWTLGASGGAPDLPGQVSLAIGYRRDYASDLEKGLPVQLPSPDDAVDIGAPATHLGTPRPRARDRGRIFLGPLCTAALAGSQGGPAAGFVTDASAAIDALAKTGNLLAANQFNAVQWSRRAASVGAIRWYYVNEGFGTQRRRQDTTLNRVHNWVAV